MSGNSTINLDSSTEPDFVPVRPGGQKLDETVDLESSSDEDEVKEEASHYVTTVQSPVTTSVLTPKATPTESPMVTSSGSEVVSSESPVALGGRPLPDGAVTSTPAVQINVDRKKNEPAISFNHSVNQSMQQHSLPVVEKQNNASRVNNTANHFDISDEFCKSNSTLQEDSVHDEGDSAISSPSQDLSTSKRERTSSEEDGDEELEADDEGDEADFRAKQSPKKRKVDDITEDQLPATCSILRTENGAVLYLIGTAHFSKESNEDVARVIQLVQPHVVMVELCPARVHILNLDEKTLMEEGQNMDLAKIRQTIKTFGTMQGAMYLLLLSLCAKLTKELGMAPGGEFRSAANEAKKIPGCQLVLADRPINVTMRRAFGSLSLWQKIRLGWNIITSDDNITKEEVEKCKQKDLLETMLEDMAGEFPELTKVFVYERDLYLSHVLHATSSHPSPQSTPTVAVGIVGIGHVEGIKKYWGKVHPREVQAVMKIPPVSMTQKAVKLVAKLSFYGLVCYGGYKLARGPITRMVNNLTS